MSKTFTKKEMVLRGMKKNNKLSKKSRKYAGYYVTDKYFSQNLIARY